MSFELEQVTVLEMDIDKCNLNYAAGACTAGTDITTGTSQAGATANTIKLAAGASAVDDFYNDNAITLADGRRAIITDYDGTTKVATVDKDWLILNLLLWSENPDKPSWTWGGIDHVTAGQTDPLGGSTAYLVIGDGFSGDEYYQDYTPGGVIPQVPFTFSMYDKSRNANNRLTMYEVGGASGTQTIVDSLMASDDIYARYEMTYTPSKADRTTIRVGVRVWAAEVLDVDVWGAMLEEASSASPYAKTEGSSLPDGVVYRIVAAGGECYNSFGTCQDKANFEKAGKTWPFCTAGANTPADEQIRPYIEKIAFAPTQIDLEKGLAPRGMVTITLADEPDSDIEADPYASTRVSAATGSFWTRLLARNHNYAGRFARIRRAYLTGAWDWADFVDELYIIESIKGPDGNGKVQVVLKDPVKLTDRVKLPAASDGALLSAITDVSTTLPLESGQGADYPSSGWVRIGDEVIKYTTNAADILGGLTRGDFDTTAATAGIGDGVQLCQVWEAASVSTVLEELANAGGIEDTYLDLTGWAAEDANWLGSAFAITACISEPTDVSKLLAEVVLQSGGYMWWSPTEQKLKFEVLAPLSPGETATLLTDEANVIEGTVKVTALDQLRITRDALFYDLRTAVSDRKEATSYLRGRIYIDADTESANEFNERRDHLHYSRLWTHLNDAAVLAVVSRHVGYYREAPKQIDLKLDAKDASIVEGTLVDLEISQITDVTGAALTTRCIVLKRKDEEGKVALTLRTTTFGSRYAFIAPAGAGDYPADIDYAHIAPAGGGDFIDGTGPYLIF